MKKLIIVSLLTLCISWTVFAEDGNRVNFPEAGFSINVPDGWESDSDGEFRYYISRAAGGGAIFISIPNKFSEMNLATYTGSVLGFNFLSFAKHGTGRIVNVKENEKFEGHPAVVAAFLVEKENNPVFAGMMIGIDWDGWYVTIMPFAPVALADQVMQEADPILESFRFDANDAEKNLDDLRAKGEQINEMLTTFYEMGRQNAQNRQ